MENSLGHDYFPSVVKGRTVQIIILPQDNHSQDHGLSYPLIDIFLFCNIVPLTEH